MKFVGRYYSNTASKTLTVAEAHTLSSAGLQLMTVYQDANNNLASFTVPKGTSQATKALQLAAAVGQPAGSAIYFAVDFDPKPVDVRGPGHAIRFELSARCCPPRQPNTQSASTVPASPAA